MDDPLSWLIETVGRILGNWCFYTNFCSTRFFLLVGGVTSLTIGIGTNLSAFSLFGGLSVTIGMVGYFLHYRNNH
jgi:hypothetical protein